MSRWQSAVPWIDVPANTLAMWDKGRKDWVGHSVEIESLDDGEKFYMVVDHVTLQSDGVFRLHLITPA